MRLRTVTRYLIFCAHGQVCAGSFRRAPLLPKASISLNCKSVTQFRPSGHPPQQRCTLGLFHKQRQQMTDRIAPPQVPSDVEPTVRNGNDKHTGRAVWYCGAPWRQLHSLRPQAASQAARALRDSQQQRSCKALAPKCLAPSRIDISTDCNPISYIDGRQHSKLHLPKIGTVGKILRY